MDKNNLDMILTVHERLDHAMQILLHRGGNQHGNKFGVEVYPCLASYWQERLVKKEELSCD